MRGSGGQVNDAKVLLLVQFAALRMGAEVRFRASAGGEVGQGLLGTTRANCATTRRLPGKKKARAFS
ncbi:MAG TPA: hypothetical protein VGZ28_11090 [Terriglobales bacterium]|nr:hypothetical protein [Terriglobales bacterium]